MKYLGVAEAKAKFSETLATSQQEPVVILTHGKPTAMVVGLEGMSLDKVAEEDPLLALLKERERQPKKPWSEVRKRFLKESK